MIGLIIWLIFIFVACFFIIPDFGLMLLASIGIMFIVFGGWKYILKLIFYVVIGVPAYICLRLIDIFKFICRLFKPCPK